MSSPHSERGRRTSQAEVTTNAKEEAPIEHPEGKLLGVAKRIWYTKRNGRRI